jgi:hypothetical protein
MRTAIGYFLIWFALLITIVFVVAAPSQSLNAHLLAFPIIALASANLLLIKR